MALGFKCIQTAILIVWISIPIVGCQDDGSTLPPPPGLEQGMTTAGDVKQAIDSQLTTIQSNPDDLSRRAELAMIYQANAMPKTSVETWNQVLSVTEDNPRHWYFLAHAEHDLGNFESAISACQRARALAPGNSQLWWQPAFWAIQMGLASQAEILAENSIDTDPDNAGGHIALALALMEQDRPQEARVVLEQLRNKVEHPYIRYLVGQSYQREGRQDLAEPWFAQGDARQPDFPDPWLDELKGYRRGIDASIDRIDSLLDQGRNSEALLAIQSALERWPDDVNIIHRQSHVYRLKGDVKRWLMTLKKAERIEPENAVTHLNLSMAYNENGELSQAINHAILAIRFNPALTRAYLQLGRLYIINDNIPKAAETLDEAFELGIDEPKERLQYAHVLLRARRPVDSEKQARLVTQVTPNNQFGWCVLAESLYAQGKREEAMQALASGLKILPGNQMIMTIRRKFEAFENRNQ